LVGIWPALPAAAPAWAVGSAAALSLAVGTLFGWLPARRAARLDPVAALARR
jgi:putative ABC transport system permease protein